MVRHPREACVRAQPKPHGPSRTTCLARGGGWCAKVPGGAARAASPASGDTEALSALSHLMQVCPFSLRVVSVVGITYLLPQEEQPLCHPTVER